MNNNNKWQYLLRQYSEHYANNFNILSCSILTIPYEVGTITILILLMHRLRLSNVL